MSKSEGTVKMRVEVTREDIDNGTPLCMWNCAIATALRRQGLAVFSVLPQSGVRWAGDGSRSILPFEAREFAALYDVGHSVAPFAFELDVPLSAMVTA